MEESEDVHTQRFFGQSGIVAGWIERLSRSTRGAAATAGAAAGVVATILGLVLNRSTAWVYFGCVIGSACLAALGAVLLQHVRLGSVTGTIARRLCSLGSILCFALMCGLLVYGFAHYANPTDAPQPNRSPSEPEPRAEERADSERRDTTTSGSAQEVQPGEPEAVLDESSEPPQAPTSITGALGAEGGDTAADPVTPPAPPATTPPPAPPTTAPTTTARPAANGVVNGCNTYGENCDLNPIYATMPQNANYTLDPPATIDRVAHGTVLRAECWATGAMTYNWSAFGEPPDPGPNPYESDVYFSVWSPSGRLGWIPDTYFVRDRANRLLLPRC